MGEVPEGRRGSFVGLGVVGKGEEDPLRLTLFDTSPGGPGEAMGEDLQESFVACMAPGMNSISSFSMKSFRKLSHFF